MKVSVKKISEITGFSPATVSNALNYKRGVNADTAAQILQVAQELGYFEENRITKVRFVIFRRDGSIVDDTPYFTQLISGVEQECRACGMEVQICNLNRLDADYREQARILFNDKSAAVILLANEMIEEDLSQIRGITTPFIVIDYWNENMGFDTIAACNADSARVATEYLIGKGHREIGYLMGDFRIKPFRARKSGYETAMQKAGLPVKPEYQVTLSTRMDSACLDMKAYLETRPKLPTAFFADNDMIALGAMKAMVEFGLKIPDDISIVGFDDLPFSSICAPPLTTIRVPKQEMGRAAVRRLRDIIHDNDGVRMKLQVGTLFVERESVREI